MAITSALVYFIACTVVVNSLSVSTTSDEHVSTSHQKNYTTRWTIEDFSLVSLTQNKFISPQFSSNVKNGLKWILAVHVLGNAHNYVGVEVYLQLVSVPKTFATTVPVLYSYAMKYESTESESRLMKERFHLNKYVLLWKGYIILPAEMKSDNLVIDAEVRFPGSSYDSVLSQLDEYDRRNAVNTTGYHDEYTTESRSMKFNLKWTLEKFVLGSYAAEKDYLQSVNFPSDSRSGFKWLLEIASGSHEKASTFNLKLLSLPYHATHLMKNVPAVCFLTVGYETLHSHKRAIFRQIFHENQAMSLGKSELILPTSANEADLVVEITVQVPAPKK